MATAELKDREVTEAAQPDVMQDGKTGAIVPVSTATPGAETPVDDEPAVDEQVEADKLTPCEVRDKLAAADGFGWCGRDFVHVAWDPAGAYTGDEGSRGHLYDARLKQVAGYCEDEDLPDRYAPDMVLDDRLDASLKEQLVAELRRVSYTYESVAQQFENRKVITALVKLPEYWTPICWTDVPPAGCEVVLIDDTNAEKSMADASRSGHNGRELNNPKGTWLIEIDESRLIELTGRTLEDCEDCCSFDIVKHTGPRTQSARTIPVGPYEVLDRREFETREEGFHWRCEFNHDDDNEGRWSIPSAATEPAIDRA